MIVCSRCGTQNPTDAGACVLCGATLSAVDPDRPTAPANPKPDLGRTIALPRPSTDTSRPAFNPGQTLALPRTEETTAPPQQASTTKVFGPGDTLALPPPDTAQLSPNDAVTRPQNEIVTRPQSAIATQLGKDAPTLPDLSDDEGELPTVQVEPSESTTAQAPALPEPVQPVRTQLMLGRTLALHGALPSPTTDPEPSQERPVANPSSAGRAGGPAPLRSTVLGLGVPNLAEQIAQQTAAQQGKPGQTLAIAPPLGAKPASRTMLGIAPEMHPNRAAHADDGAAPGEAAGPAPHTRTILGIARPGIAPINPGVRKPDADPEKFPTPPPPPHPRESATPAAPIVPRAPPRPSIGARTMTLRAARKSTVAAVVAIAAAVMLLAAGAGVYFYLAGPEKIEARVVLDPEGRERILLRCPGCKDGTVVRLEGVEAGFKNQQAELSLQRTLKVGETPFSLGVRAPGSKRENTVSLSVRIDYRVRADLGGLAEPTPRVRVLVHAIPGSRVTVDDRPVALSAAGQGTAEFDVSRELTGQDNGIRRLERRIGYSVAPPGGTRQDGEVIVQLGIAALVVDAPGATITVETPTFVLAGRTLKGGSASVEGRPLRVDADGRFAQVMNVSSVGETTITLRAVAPEHAPRLFPIRVRRVASFAEEAAKVRAQATGSYASIADDLEKKRDWKVALDGSVLERSNLEHSTLLLFEVTSGCRVAPCLARVTYGARSDMAPGDRVSIFGRVTGAVDGPRRNTKIPEILADFLIKAKR